MTNSYPYVLVINPKLGVTTLKEFVALAKEKAGGFNYGTTGVGAANHLMSELFCAKAGVKMTHIPYRGTALAVADCVSGQVTMVFGDPVSVLPHINAGTLRAIAVSSPQRSPVAPTVPTMAESGYPDVEAVAWHGIFVPARTPQEIVDKLNARDREGAGQSRDQGSAQQAGHVARRQHAGGIRRLPEEGHRDLERRRGIGKSKRRIESGRATESLPQRGPCSRTA